MSKLPEWLPQSGIRYDEAAIRQELEQKKQVPENQVVRVFIIVGIILSSVLLVSILLVLGIHESPTIMLALGVFGYISGLLWHRRARTEVFDFWAISLLVMGYGSITYAFAEWELNTWIAFPIMALLSVVSVLFSFGFILPFLGTLSFYTVLLTWIAVEKQPLLMVLFVGLLHLELLVLYLAEGKFIASFRKLSRHFDPIRLGTVMAIQLALFIFTPFYIPFVSPEQPFANYELYYSIPSSVLCFYTVYYLSPAMGFFKGPSKMAILSIIGILLILTIYAPAISSTLLLLLLTYYGRHATGVVLAGLALIYAITMYYYEMEFTLLAKSFVLMGTGLIFITGFVLLNRFLKNHGEER